MNGTRMSRLIQLFPRAWRDRYGDEFTALLEVMPMRPRTVFDVLLYAARSHRTARRAQLRETGGVNLGFVPAPAGKAGGLALLGLLLTLPSIGFATANIVEYNLGLVGFADVVNGWAASPFAPFALLGFPVLGVTLAMAPILGVTVAAPHGAAVRVGLVLHLRARNLAVGGVAVAAGGALTLYAVLENL